jgi:hypothetical protein
MAAQWATGRQGVLATSSQCRAAFSLALHLRCAALHLCNGSICGSLGQLRDAQPVRQAEPRRVHAGKPHAQTRARATHTRPRGTRHKHTYVRQAIVLYYSDMCILLLALFFYIAAIMLAEDGGMAEVRAWALMCAHVRSHVCACVHSHCACVRTGGRALAYACMRMRVRACTRMLARARACTRACVGVRTRVTSPIARAWALRTTRQMGCCEANSNCFMIGVGCDGYCCTGCYGYGASAHRVARSTARTPSLCVPASTSSARRLTVRSTSYPCEGRGWVPGVQTQPSRPRTRTAATRTRACCRPTAPWTPPCPPGICRRDDHRPDPPTRSVGLLRSLPTAGLRSCRSQARSLVSETPVWPHLRMDMPQCCATRITASVYYWMPLGTHAFSVFFC